MCPSKVFIITIFAFSKSILKILLELYQEILQKSFYYLLTMTCVVLNCTPPPYMVTVRCVLASPCPPTPCACAPPLHIDIMSDQGVPKKLLTVSPPNWHP